MALCECQRSIINNVERRSGISRRAALGLAAGVMTARPCVVVLDVQDGSVLRCDDPARANGVWAAPGSAIKPITWMALPKHGTAPCRKRLEIAGRRLDCTHAEFIRAVDGESALAASCNCWFAAMARDLDAARFQQILLRAGAKASFAEGVEQLQMQALGLEGVRFSPMALARAYTKVALSSDATLRRGLERAVLEGTAQWAAPDGLSVAGKTGTTSEGAWFAGYAPARAPHVVVCVFTEQGRGGSDAAPAARKAFAWWQRSGFSR